MTIYQGGYLLLNEPLVRVSGANSHTARDLSLMSDYTISALNAVQETPWAINAFVLEVVIGLASAGKNVTLVDDMGEETVILRLEKPIDPKKDASSSYNFRYPKEEWDVMSAEQRKAVRQQQALWLQTYEEEQGEWKSAHRVIKLAHEMSQFPKFYFPHSMDFRTRFYPIPTDLTPQANDLPKGLLKFARGTALGSEGVYWMGFTVATRWGKDKLHPDDRVAYASAPEFMAQCAAWVDDPLTNRGWMEADEPFEFLAVAFEWVWAHRMGDPKSFVSYLPGNLDGSCNGAQHLSLLSLDPVGAKATNCTSSSERGDLYMEVANHVFAQVQRDAAEGNSVAIYWEPRLAKDSYRRKVVKRAVMTVPYGVSAYGIAKFMFSDRFVDAKRPTAWDEAKYIRNLILEAVENKLRMGRELQRWFSACAQVCAKNGLPMSWLTPAGSKVTMAYRNLIAKRVKSFDNSFYVYEEPDEGESKDSFHSRIGMDEAKMMTAAPPNVVHACDASHLQITVCRMTETGISDFAMIHDSFGCPFAYMGTMRDILRQSAVDMYTEDYLEVFKASVEKFSGLTMPNPPMKGEFDLAEVLRSIYFFS